MQRLLAIKNLIKAIKFFVFLTLLTPLVVVPQSFFPFGFWRVLLIRIFTEIILVFYIFLLCLDKKYWPKKNWLNICVGSFFLILIISTIFSINPYHSFWSNQERMEGLLTMLHFGVLFFVLAGVWHEKKDWLWIFKVTVSVSFICSFYAFLQKLNVPWHWVYLGSAARLSGTIGNPAFLASYLIFNIFLGFILWRELKTKIRYFYLLISLFDLLVLYWTATRGALVGILTAIVLGAGFIIFSPIRKQWRLLVIGLVIAGLLLGFVLYYFRGSAWPVKIFGLGVYRLTHTSLRGSPDVQSRLLSWQTAWSAWQDKPIIGWGPESYLTAFNYYFSQKFLQFSAGAWFDRPHNKILEVGVTSGWLGVIVYLGIFVLALVALMRWWLKTKRRDWVPVFLILALVAYFIQNLFIFDTPASYLLFFVVLAFLLTGFNLNQSIKKDNFVRQVYSADYQKVQFSKKQKFGLSFLIVFILWLTFKANIKPATANYHLNLAFTGQRRQTTLDDYKIAMFRHSFVQAEARVEFSRDVIGTFNKVKQMKQPTASLKPLLVLAAEQMEQNLKLYPENPAYCLYLAQIYKIQGFNIQDAALKKELLKKSENLILKAKKMSPYHPEIYYELGALYISQENYPKAIAVYQELTDIAPRLEEAWWRLAVALDLSGQPAPAWQLIHGMGTDYFKPEEHHYELLAFLNMAQTAGDYFAVIKATQLYLSFDSQNVEVMLALVDAYARTYQWPKALKIAEQIKLLRPDLTARVSDLLKELELYSH